MFTAQQKQNWQENITAYQPFGRWSDNYSLRHTFCDRQGQGVLQLIGYGDTTGSTAFNPSDIGSTNLSAAISEDISFDTDPFNVFLTQIQGGGGKLIETVLVSTLTDFIEESLSIPEANSLRIFIGEQSEFSNEGTGFPNTDFIYRLVGEIDLPAITREQTPRDFVYRNWIYVPPSGNLFVGLAKPALYGVSFKVLDLQGYPKITATPFVGDGGALSDGVSEPVQEGMDIDIQLRDATWASFKPRSTTPPTDGITCEAVDIPATIIDDPPAEFRTVIERVELPPLLRVERTYILTDGYKTIPFLLPNGDLGFLNSPLNDTDGRVAVYTTGGGDGTNPLAGPNPIAFYIKDSPVFVAQFKYVTRNFAVPPQVGAIVPPPESINCEPVPGCLWRSGTCAEGEVSRGWVTFEEGTLNQCCLPGTFPPNDRGCDTCVAPPPGCPPDFLLLSITNVFSVVGASSPPFDPEPGVFLTESFLVNSGPNGDFFFPGGPLYITSISFESYGTITFPNQEFVYTIPFMEGIYRYFYVTDEAFIPPEIPADEFYVLGPRIFVGTLLGGIDTVEISATLILSPPIAARAEGFVVLETDYCFKPGEPPIGLL